MISPVASGTKSGVRGEREKYPDELSFRATQARRALVRGFIGGIVDWNHCPATEPGYTVIIGCNSPLIRMLACNLRFLAMQDLRSVQRVLVVVDRPRKTLPDDAEPAMRARFPSLPLEFLYYTPHQRRVCDLVGWPWVQSWLSWSIGISETRTRHAMLHDFDAMLLRPHIMYERFRAIADREVQFLGVKYYEGNGVVPADGLVTTFELLFDVNHVRGGHAPLDLFNHVTRHRGRRVDFDTFLRIQSLGGKILVDPIAEEDMVHPSQLICHFEDLRLGRRAVPATNGLPLIPYFLFAGDEHGLLQSMTEQFDRGTGPSVDFMGKQLDLSRLPPCTSAGSPSRPTAWRWPWRTRSDRRFVATSARSTRSSPGRAEIHWPCRRPEFSRSPCCHPRPARSRPHRQRNGGSSWPCSSRSERPPPGSSTG